MSNTDRQEPCAIHTWVAEPMPTDVRQAIARLARCEDVWHIAVMPDVHLAEQVCVGLAVATRRLVYPDAVGGDIGCGMAAIGLDGAAGPLRRERDAMALLGALRVGLPVNRRGGDRLLAYPDEVRPQQLSRPALQNLAAHNGRYLFGTLGSGNHFVEFQADEEDRLWLMVHSGSRGMGPAIRQAHRGPGSLPALDAESADGEAYLNDAGWAERYARANRRALLHAACEAAADILGVLPIEGSLIECCHNHVCRENHFGHDCWVHRKGAMSAAAGEPGIIPGSMGTASFHVEGRGEPAALSSSSHGAGRRLSRASARATISTRDLHRQLGEVWFDAAISHALREEAPKAYRDIRAVMRAQADLVKVVRGLTPLVSYKGT